MRWGYIGLSVKKQAFNRGLTTFNNVLVESCLICATFTNQSDLSAMNHLLTRSVTGLWATILTITAFAQAPATSGKITYEGMRRVDASQMRMVINGQEVRPGSPGAPDAPEGMPDVISFTQKLVFSGTMAKEERDRSQNMMMRRTMGGDGAGGQARNGQPRDVRMAPPFEQTTFIDLANRSTIEVMAMKKDSVSTVYRTDRPLPKAEGWELSDKTKKIAGYVCHKATVLSRASRRPRPNGNGAAGTPAAGASDQTTASQPAQALANTAPEVTYTIWYTTDLPFTYSPVANLTPEKGVVLLIESDNDSYKATSVSMEAVDQTAVQPPKDAKTVSPDEMNQMRRKAMADFRQRAMGSMNAPGRN